MIDSQKNQNIIDSFNSKDLSFAELFFLIRKHKLLILIVFSLIMFSVISYTFLSKPVYRSTGMIMIEEPSSSSIFQMGIGTEQNFLQNEIRILKSRTVSELTILKLIDSDLRNDLFLLGTRKHHNFPLSNLKEIFQINNSSDIVFSNSPPFVPDSILNQLSKKLRESVNIQNERNTDMINISVDSYSDKESALLVNTIIDVYKSLDLQWATGEMSHLKTFLTEQISKKEIELKRAENQLKDLQKQDKIFTVDDKSKLLLQNLTRAETELYNLKAKMNIASERKKYIQDELSMDENKFVEDVSSTVNQRLYALQNELAKLEMDIISAIGQQGENHEIVRKLKAKSERLKQNLELETKKMISNGIAVANPLEYRQSLMDTIINLSALYANMQNKEIEFSKLVKKYESQLSDLPDKVLEFTTLTRNLNIHAETYSLMRQKLEEARINEASQVGQVRIIDSARVQPKPVKPNKKVNLFFGLIFSLLGVVIVVTIREFLDYTVKTIEEIDRKGLTILALIPSLSNKKNRKKENKEISKFSR